MNNFIKFLKFASIATIVISILYGLIWFCPTEWWLHKVKYFYYSNWALDVIYHSIILAVFIYMRKFSSIKVEMLRISTIGIASALFGVITTILFVISYLGVTNVSFYTYTNYITAIGLLATFIWLSFTISSKLVKFVCILHAIFPIIIKIMGELCYSSFLNSTLTILQWLILALFYYSFSKTINDN